MCAEHGSFSKQPQERHSRTSSIEDSPPLTTLPALGLTARAPAIGNTPASHVAGARQSQWISTTRSRQIAEDVFGKHGVVEIDLSRVLSSVADVSGGIPGLPPNAMLSNWARKYQEILVQDRIPPEAITGRVL